MRAVALVVAAGSGERLGAAVPKAFVECAGRPLLEWSLAALAAAGLGDDVVVAVPADALGDAALSPRAAALSPRAADVSPRAADVEPRAADVPPRAADVQLSAAGATPRLAGGGGPRYVAGGATRSESVAAAFAAIADLDADAVLVHDAARPLVPPALFASVLAALEDADAATAAAPMADTVKVAGPDRVVTDTLDRRRLWAVQTPQAFRRDVLAAALAADPATLAAATDDCSLVEAQGGRVVVVPGPPENFKVTTAHDLRVASLLLAGGSARSSAAVDARARRG